MNNFELWWKQAARDLVTAKNNQRNKDYYAASLFAQQAVEKALKAMMIKKLKKLEKTHDLVFLAKKLELPDKIIKACDKLNPVYLEARYPDASGKLPSQTITKQDTELDIILAEGVLKWIKNRL